MLWSAAYMYVCITARFNFWSAEVVGVPLPAVQFECLLVAVVLVLDEFVVVVVA